MLNVWRQNVKTLLTLEVPYLYLDLLETTRRHDVHLLIKVRQLYQVDGPLRTGTYCALCITIMPISDY